MKNIITLTLCALSCSPLFAQYRQAPTNYFEGTGVSLGVSANKSRTSSPAPADNKSSSSSVGIAKLSYGFATTSAFKLGLSISTDLSNSEISNGISVKRKTPTEFTIEPGVLLTPVTLAYAKLGSYSATYATPLGSQNISGNTAGLGLKSYLTQRTFILGEFTQHKATGSAFLGWDKFKQTSTAVMVGYNY